MSFQQKTLSALWGKKTAASHPERREISDGESKSDCCPCLMDEEVAADSHNESDSDMD